MTTEKLTTKTIKELKGKNFFVPAYQRGYRWKEQQVEDLLEDIWDFSQKLGKNDKEFYCLQPVVVKNCQAEGNTTPVCECCGHPLEEPKWEVIDGQQRLTTIFIILKSLDEHNHFSLEYETREQSKEFLENLQPDKKPTSDDNIDFCHMQDAYNAVESWFTEAQHSLCKDKIKQTLLDNTRIIWYQAGNEDARDIFARLNVGKIPLTDAELVKALFLNSSNFSNVADTEKIRLMQMEIAGEWDRMERALHNDELWLFINKDKNDMPVRMEFLLELVMRKDGKNPEQKGEHAVFRHFYGLFSEHKANEDIIKTQWEEIKRCFMTIEEWFNNCELYNRIGYLITAGSQIIIDNLLKESNNKSKSNFKRYLKNQIKDLIKIEPNEELVCLTYGDKRLKNILLLHNIATSFIRNIKFPFHKYKNNNAGKKQAWDIEHIHAVATENPPQDHQRGWLISAKEWLDAMKEDKESLQNAEFDNAKELTEDIDAFLTGPNDERKFADLYDRIMNSLPDDTNNIGNLVLLNAGINRSFKNDFFNKKRQHIIANDNDGAFIPICTRKVFLKYYNENPTQIKFWSKNDRDAYRTDIKNKLRIFLDSTNKQEV